MLGILVFLLLTGMAVPAFLFAPLTILICENETRYSLHGLVMVSNEDCGEHLDHESIGILRCKSNLQSFSPFGRSEQRGN